MLTTILTIQGVAVEAILALHKLFEGDELCSEVIASARVSGANAEQMREWMGTHKRFPVAGLKSRQYNAKQKTHTVIIELLCECDLEDVVFTSESVKKSTTRGKCKFRPSQKALLAIYQLLGWFYQTESLEIVE